MLGDHFDGLAINMVEQCNHSAARLVELLVSFLPGFRDEATYKGRKVYFYKRAQILVSDLWAAYGQRSGDQLFGFFDLHQLTMFADYRVPQVLVQAGILVYSEALKAKVLARELLEAGSEEEVEIRAATIRAVECLRDRLRENHSQSLLSIEIDWLLWHEGEEHKDDIFPHHRTLTCFY
ncbi:unnamed protein product [Chrysoparadoxa australica]